MEMQFLPKPTVADLAKRNSILRQRFWQNRYDLISPITNADRELYHRFFARDCRVACYGNSWTYITQACRGFGLGLKYHDGDLLLSIGFHKGHYVVVRPLGTIDDRMMDVLAMLRSVSGKPVFVKKPFPDQVTKLLQLGNFQEAVRYSELRNDVERGDYPWDEAAFADDDTYPELILDVNITLNYSMAPKDWFADFKKARITSVAPQTLKTLRDHYLKFRGKFKRFLRSGIHCHLTDYDVGIAEDIRKFLSNHFGKEDKQNKEAYENMLTQLPLGTNGDAFFSFVAYLEDRSSPVGFFVAERLDEKSAGLYAAVASRCCPGLSEYLHMEMLSRLQRVGIALLNIGGSEVKSLHDFKCKLAPIEERYMRLMVYGVS